jgi:hypothetical protein
MRNGAFGKTNDFADRLAHFRVVWERNEIIATAWAGSGDCSPKLLAPNNTNGCTEQCVWPKPAMAQADSA